ncbi:MAG: YncE family protein, partial [Nitrososphaerales archaeon]
MHQLALAFFGLLLLSSLFANQEFAYSDSANGSVAVGLHPRGLAVNPDTNKIYVTNYESASVSVIDGNTNTLVANITVGVFPAQVAVNPTNDKVYVIHRGAPGSIVSVIDGETNTIIETIEIGFDAIGLAVNANTDKIYVSYSNSTGSLIFVIDGSLNEIVDTLSFSSGLIAVNPATNRLYTLSGKQINAIDGETNTIIETNEIGDHRAIHLVVNPNTNMIYVLNSDSPTPDIGGLAIPMGSLFVIDGSMDRIIANFTVGLSPAGMAINPDTNTLYVTLSHARSVLVIDGNTNKVVDEIKITNSPMEIAVNSKTNIVYVVNELSNSITVI